MLYSFYRKDKSSMGLDSKISKGDASLNSPGGHSKKHKDQFRLRAEEQDRQQALGQDSAQQSQRGASDSRNETELIKSRRDERRAERRKNRLLTDILKDKGDTIESANTKYRAIIDYYEKLNYSTEDSMNAAWNHLSKNETDLIGQNY